MPNDALTFDPATHTYRLYGRVIPSVTQVLDDLLPGWHADEWYLQRGTAVHACAAMIAQGIEFESDPAISGQVAACRQWFADVRPLVNYVERRVCSARHGYAGTLDMLAGIGAHLVVIDWKASAGPAAVYQLAGYALALGEMGLATVRHGATVTLAEDGTYKMSEVYDILQAMREFPALVVAHNVRRRFGASRRAENG